MIKITKGPSIQKYADIYGCDVEEVIEWVSGYVNGPWSEALEPHIEKTERERFESIKGYIAAMINCSTTARIKKQLEKEKNESKAKAA